MNPLNGARTHGNYRSIDGADGEVKVPNGEWYINTKARNARMMKNGLSRGARQVHACLEPATMGFNREKALVQEKAGAEVTERPQTFADIARVSGLDDADVSRFFKELCAEGLAESREIIPGKGLHKGNIQLYSWAQPREPKKELLMVRAPSIPDWFPTEDPDLEPLRKDLIRRRTKIPQHMDGGARTTFMAMCEEAARTRKKYEEEVARLEEYARAQSQTVAHIKEDRTTDIKRQTPQPAVPVLVPEPEPDPEAPEEPAGRLEEGLEVIDGSAKARVGEHLAKFDVPSPLTPETVALVAEHLPTQALVDHFIEATANDKPRSWGFFIKKAPKIVEDHPRYMAAKAGAGNGSPPGQMTLEEQRVKEFARRYAVTETKAK